MFRSFLLCSGVVFFSPSPPLPLASFSSFSPFPELIANIPSNVPSYFPSPSSPSSFPSPLLLSFPPHSFFSRLFRLLPGLRLLLGHEELDALVKGRDDLGLLDEEPGAG